MQFWRREITIFTEMNENEIKKLFDVIIPKKTTKNIF